MGGDDLARALDLVGIFVFGISGASLAARRGFDVVGLVVLALATGLGGGIIRDVLIGGGPPLALQDGAYLATPGAAALVVLLAPGIVAGIERPVLVFDAAGLAVFAVAGASRGVEAGLGVGAAILVGTITAVGGGVLRDVLARDVPAVFRPDTALYAIPAALGATVTVIAARLDAYGTATAVVVALGVFLLRLLALRFHWRAPTARRVRDDDAER